MSVYLREGTYELDQTFEIDSRDSGTKTAPVVYTAYENEQVRLTGAKNISVASFSPLTDAVKQNQLSDPAAGAHIVVCDLAALGLTRYGEIGFRAYGFDSDFLPQMELSVDGERQTLAKYPNQGFTKYQSVVPGREGARTKSGIRNGAAFYYSGSQPEKWNKPNEIFVSGVLGANYSYDYYPVGSIDTDNKVVNLSIGAIVPYYSKHFFWYENIFEEIDAPGEYYIDREDGLLYWYPPKALDADTNISVSYLEKPMIKTNNASFVTFAGLQLDGGRDSAIVVSETEGLKIINCDIRNFGKRGISIHTGKRTEISGCKLYNIGNTAITVGGSEVDYVNLESNENLIENNEISQCAYIDKAYATGILLSYHSVGATVRHNKIYDTPHAAMMIYGPAHKIEYNEISDAVKDFHDMDAIYMNVSEFPWERGVVFQRNYIHDLGRQKFPEEDQMNVAGIRSDNNGHGITVTENVFANIGKKNAVAVRGVCARGTRNIITKNIFVDTAETFNANETYIANKKYDMNDETVKKLQSGMNSRLPVYGQKYPELYTFFNEHPDSAYKTNVFEDNLIVNIKYPLSVVIAAPNSQGFRGADELVKSQGNYLTDVDPGFVRYENNNFKLRTDSVVFQAIPGFTAIPFDQIGLQ